MSGGIDVGVCCVGLYSAFCAWRYDDSCGKVKGEKAAKSDCGGGGEWCIMRVLESSEYLLEKQSTFD